MKLLQCGCPRSGNYGLFKILQAILGQKYQSYLSKSGIRSIIDTNFSEYITYPETNITDNFKIIDGKTYLFFPSPVCKLIEVDGDLLVSNSNLLWTHDTADVIDEPVLKPVTHAFYLIRDGREVINSLAHYTTTPVMMKLNPVYRWRTVEEVYNDYELFSGWVLDWRKHVQSYADNSNRYLCISLENIKEQPYAVLESIKEYLDVDFDTHTVMSQIQYNTLAKRVNYHFKKSSCSWRDHFTDKHKQIFKDIAGEALIEADYEKNKDW